MTADEHTREAVFRIVRRLGDALVHAQLEIAQLRAAAHPGLAESYAVDVLADRASRLLETYGELVEVAAAMGAVEGGDIAWGDAVHA